MERIEAISKGLDKYDTGRPCKYNHASIRYSKTGICVECAKANNKRYVRKYRYTTMAHNFGLAVLTMKVHHETYTGLFNAIQTVNALMGVHEAVNKPDYLPSPIDGSLMRREDVEQLYRDRDAPLS